MERFQDREVVSFGVRDAAYPFIEISSLVTLKIAIYNAMVEKNLRKADLARLLKRNPTQIDRLLYLNHATKLDSLESTLNYSWKRGYNDYPRCCLKFNGFV